MISMQLKQTAKQIAINTAKVASHEASETLKSIKSQVGLEVPQQNQEKKQPEQKQPNIDKVKHNQSVHRQMAGLEKELEDIKNLKLQKEKERLQTHEQIKVAPPPPIESKKGRRIVGAMKKAKTTVLNVVSGKTPIVLL